MEKTKPSIYFILGSGGHTKQMLLLQEKFDDSNYDKKFICSKKDIISQEKVKKAGEYVILFVSRPREPGERIIRALIRNVLFFGFFKQLFEAVSIVRKMKKSLVISAGPSTGFFVFLLASIMGNYCVYLESWSRVKELSLSGKIYKRFAQLFFVQWKEQCKNVEDLIYKGRLL